jgi:ribonuclease-3
MRKSRQGSSPQRLPIEPCGPEVRDLAALVVELPEELWRQAVTHYTWIEGGGDSYKSLAFIGDSVLDLFIAEDLRARFPNRRSGWLTQIRSKAVSATSCKQVGQALGVPAALEAIEEPQLAKAVPTRVLLEAVRPIAEITEALIGAAHLTFGFERTRVPVLAAFEPQIQAGIEEPLDPKTMLHHRLSRHRLKATYEVVSRSGSRFDPKFEVAVIADSRQIGRGIGRSRKAAEHAAATSALDQLDTDQSITA